ncbi:hypothetical protein DFH07DRAFT_769671 [Mycena maculata]|uniref:Uncharacterized protein n=1 Tax=Mycena maculata TaxID=230809 RepID=A0AAD7JKU0_9AGAR|nr:hypothetical protein DFH07DRAFT_769671 [Mycena maculata]
MVPDKPTIIYEKRTKMNKQGKTIPELEIVMQGNSAMPTHTAAYITATALFPRHKFKFSKLATDAKGNSDMNGHAESGPMWVVRLSCEQTAGPPRKLSLHPRGQW